MNDQAKDRLTTIIDEAFGLQPVQESTDELLTLLERLLFESRMQRIRERDDAVFAERQRVAELIGNELSMPPLYSQKNRAAAVIRKLREGS